MKDARDDGERRRQFEALAGELEGPLMAAAMRLTRNRADAEDLLQETWYRGFRHFDQFRPGTNFRAWMFRIEMNEFRNRWRRRRLEPGLTDFGTVEPGDREHVPQVEGDPAALERALDRFVDDEVKEAVEELPGALRSVLLLTGLGEFSYRETADALEIPVGTVMSRLHRARRRVRGSLAAYAASRRLPVPEPAAA